MSNMNSKQSVSDHPAGPERSMSAAKLAAFRCVEDVWKQEVSARASRVRIRFAAMAASLVGLAAVLTLVSTNDLIPRSTSLPSHTIVRIEGGQVTRNGEYLGPHDPADPSVIVLGDRIATGADSRLAIKWQGFGSLRLDQNSAITVIGDSVVRLDKGGAYFDSKGHRDLSAVDGNVLRSAVLRIETPYGMAEHLGTQFLVTANADQVNVLVREGVVNFNIEDEALRVASNAKLSITKADVLLEEQGLVDQQAWKWVASISPRIAVDAHSTYEVLTWAAREQGLTVRYRQPEARLFAKTDRLMGLGAIDPQQALSMISQITDLQYEVSGDNLLVDLKPTP
jgi:hypothetical protein